MNTRSLCLGILAVAILGGATSVGMAADGPWFLGSGYAWWYYPPRSYDPSRVPYYALYPPVYYSQPVARPYGYSPFAYPPGFITPEATATPTPQFSEREAPAATPRPLRVSNPYVNGAGETPVSDTSLPPGQAPKVVHPAALAAAE